MVGPKQFKRVSWAPGLSICQVRLFLSEDAPSQSALGSQDHLQAKAAWLLHSNSTAPDDSVPPGFEAFPRGQIQRNIPTIKWQRPPIQWMKPEWLVVAGEESQEVASQNRRQLAVLEAVYPRSSSIPPDPSISPEVQLATVDDSRVPLIPIIAKEDEDSPEQDVPAQTAASGSSIPVVVVPATIPNIPRASVEPDIAAAASAAFTAIMRSNEEGSLIDRDLLIKLLCDPSMLEKLASEHAISKQAQLPAQPPPTVTHPEPIIAPTLAPNLDPQPLCSPRVTITRATAVPIMPLPAKDANYYKSLIQKHGGDRHETTEPAPQYETSHEYHSNPLGSIYMDGRHEQRQSDSRKPRTVKPCAYYNTPRGCRQGASCTYLHDSTPSTNSYLQASSKNIMQQQRGAKRIKFDR